LLGVILRYHWCWRRTAETRWVYFCTKVGVFSESGSGVFVVSPTELDGVDCLNLIHMGEHIHEFSKGRAFLGQDTWSDNEVLYNL